MLVKPVRARAMALYADAFGDAPAAAASAPGCVDLLGAHTDSNGGAVLTIATRERTVVAVGRGDPGILEGVNADGRRERIDLRDAQPVGWLALVAGVLHELGGLGAVSDRVRVAVASDLSEQSGSAAAAALAVAVAKALVALNALALTPRKLAGVAFRAGRQALAEHTNAVFAHADEALLIECASAETRRVPLSARVLLVDTGVPSRGDRRGERQVECNAAVLRLKMEIPELHWLASWPTAWLARLKKALPQPLRSRAVHVVSETARTRFGAELLAQGRRKRFGELLYESHESCRRLFDASTPEADLVVSVAHRAGALGARLTSTGSGGTVVVLLGKGEGGRGKGEAKVIAAIQRAYAKAFGREVVITPVRPGEGVRLEPVPSKR